MAEAEPAESDPTTSRLRRILPAPGSPKYHLLLAGVTLLILGPLGGVTGAYMTFSLGFFVGGQVLAGILGSVVTYGYGPEGKHGSNYMQTMAASVSDMSAMGVVIQAMIWLGLPQPPAWVLVVYMTCIGMFGVGLGMMYTPILVDRMQLEFPSGHAVANILRALTDKTLLRRSIGKLGGGAGLGVVVAGVVEHVERLGRIGVSASTVGTGLIVGSRIAVPALVMGGILAALVPHFRASGWLGPHDPARKIGFLIALAMIFGAALVDLALIGVEAVRRFRALGAGPAADAPKVESQSGGLRGRGLALWIVGWGAALAVVATQVLHQPPGFILFAMGLAVVFVFINGIATGISDSNPISSAFVVAVLLMSALGLRDPGVGMMAASILLISCLIGVDMQQDRSTGWRLGTNRSTQFRYQAVGIVGGAILCVGLARFFLHRYPVLNVDIFTHPEADVGKWQSAMTFKFVGALRGLGHLDAYKLEALGIGLSIGIVTEVIRKVLARSAAWKAYRASGPTGFAVGWLFDAILLSSPYASSFGGFVELSTSLWFAVGGVVSSLVATIEARRRREGVAGAALPEDMSTTSLVGGGLIAGESIFTLVTGIISMFAR